MPYDPQKHHRRSIRLAGYNYSSAGATRQDLISAFSVKTPMQANNPDGIGGSLLPRGPKPASLGAIMSQFKSYVTKRLWKISALKNTPIWQRNYYEHILRNERELENIHRYIESNPINWTDDDENPNRVNL